MCQEKLVQEAVDTLLDNGIRGQPMRDGHNKVYKSFSDVIEGKEGRFRETLLGKRVDYSGRSVIVVGPSLSLHRCGLPREIAIELFQTFVIRGLIRQHLAPNIGVAKSKIREKGPIIWEILQEVMRGHPVLLNRAPTLHRLGIQAFQPILVEGRAICLHPLVCKGFNADFDGDQMAVHVPLSLEAQAEARLLMFSHMNLLSPAIGDPISVPTQDMLIGLYVLTSGNRRGICANRQKRINLDSPLWLRWRLDQCVIASREAPIEVHYESLERANLVFHNKVIDGTAIKRLISRLIDHFGMAYTSHILDQVKTLGFQQATATSISLGIDDLLTIPSKGWLVQDAEQQSLILEKHHHFGNVHAVEKLRQSIEIWYATSEYLRQEMNPNFRMTDPFNPVHIMSFSGARGNASQVHQLVGMRGLMSDPQGQMIDLPIQSNLREGLSLTEYIISCYGARKGVVDTAVRTSDAGYLTRRLVEVVQHIVVRRTDCGTTRGISVSPQKRTLPERIFIQTLIGRVLADDIYMGTRCIAIRNQDIGLGLVDRFRAFRTQPISIRTPFTCRSTSWICRLCYGRSATHGDLVELGEAVVIRSAKPYLATPGAIVHGHYGEILYQGDTLVTFIYEKSRSGDITQGLPKVEQVLEVRSIDSISMNLEKRVEGWNEYITRILGIPWGFVIGAELTIVQSRLSLVNKIQKVYRSQGVQIHNRHIEIIVRQITSKVLVSEDGMSNVFLPGELIGLLRAERTGRALEEAIWYRVVLLGITRASLNTQSFISEASFQETARVLAKAALRGRIDWLKGLKENVVLGGMIPAGTGFKGLVHRSRQHNNILLETKKKNFFGEEMRDIFFHHRELFDSCISNNLHDTSGYSFIGACHGVTYICTRENPKCQVAAAVWLNLSGSTRDVFILFYPKSLMQIFDRSSFTPKMASQSDYKATIIDGKAIAQAIRSEIADEARQLSQKYGKVPGLAVVIVGNRKDSQSYVAMKRKACAEVGIRSFDVNLPEQVPESELISKVHELNENPDVHGILVQLPLPKHINEEKVLGEISLEKDVDGFHPLNIGKLAMKGREPLFQPCTPKGCLELLSRSGVSIKGKNAVVVGRSNIVGLPVSLLLLKADATVSIVHSRTPDPERLVREADIVIAAAGQARMIKGSWIKPGAAVIDVGTNAVDDPTKKSGYMLVGDVDFEEASKVAGWITPVPGGVGPMTVAMLLRNTLDGAKRVIEK
ncbi:hypothetical protein V6N11_058250 [Hibiscus sabdariffa]|uniref:RNA polymerase N-terminal domain-containing protein n=2 Tax=Malvoideae TaxID=214907 RepID=A0ABR2NGA2_9ROSI